MPQLPVMSVHGIRTRGAWQKTLADILSAHQFPVKSIDYGYYRIDQMIRPWLNEGLLDRFLAEYQAVLDKYQTVIDLANPQKRPSVIAHSMGTYVVGYAMQKYDEIKFDKIIMCGGILPVDFDWDTLFDHDQVNIVRNEYGLRDTPSRFAASAIRRAGPSGRYGFSYLSNRLDEEQYLRYRHSDFFSVTHIEKSWLPFLMRTASPYGVKHGRDIATLDEFRAITEHTAKIDDDVFKDANGYDEVQIKDDIAEKWVGVNPDIYTFIYDRATSEYCGYINAMPLTDDALQLVKKGALKDNDVPADAVVPFVGPANMKMYFMSIAVDPNKPKLGQGLHSTELETLLRGFFAKLSHYARHNKIRVTEIVAVGWTATGRKICEKLFGMNKIGTDKFGNPIFSLTLDDKLKNASMYGALRRLISDYDELLKVR